MTLKFPLVNLISRGHLSLANRTACLNFAKNIEDGPATRICYEMMKCDDLHDAAKMLEEAVNAHRELTEGSRAYFAESNSFTNARNMILMRESGDMRGDPTDLGINPYQQFMTILKTGGIGAAMVYMLKLTDPEKDQIMNNLKSYNRKIYDLVQDSIAGRMVGLKKDPSYYARLFNSAVGSKTRQGLSKDEITSLQNFGKKAGWAALAAVGIPALIIALSMFYKRHFSVEAKACKAYSGKERTVCMTKARIKACDAAVNAAKKALLDCGSAKNEEDCIFKMKVEIRSWSKKKALEEEKLRKLMNVNKTSFDDSAKKNDPFS